MRTPPLICVIGPDGAGKTTQARRISRALCDRGVPNERRWLGFTHLVSLPLLGVARAMGLSEVKTLESGRSVGYHYFFRSRALSILYPVLLFVDMFMLAVVRVYLPIALGRTVVGDRFVHDAIVNVMVSTRRDDFHETRLGRAFLWLLPSDTTTVLLIADAEVLRDRRDDIRADHTIERKVELYEKLAADLDIPCVDASRSPDRVHREIRTVLGWDDP